MDQIKLFAAQHFAHVAASVVVGRHRRRCGGFRQPTEHGVIHLMRRDAGKVEARQKAIDALRVVIVTERQQQLARAGAR